MSKYFYHHHSVPVLFTLLFTGLSLSEAPPANTIPIISMKTGQDETCEDITLDVICNLLWNNFDGIWVEGWLENYLEAPLELCDSTNAVAIVAPSILQQLSNWHPTRWARYPAGGLQSASAFFQPNEDFSVIDTTRYATAMISDIEDRCETLAAEASSYKCIWYYDIMNEGSSWQLRRMLDPLYAYDDYFPDMFAHDTMMTQIVSTGIFSWTKFKSDSMYSNYTPSISVCFGILHTIEKDEWGGFNGISLGSDITQANSVRAYFNTRYLVYASQPPYALEDNFPERMDLNTYPVRMAGYDWQDDEDSISVLGSATDLWMLEHYENLMDSTFIPAGTDADGPYPINYHPQAFGRTGGEAVWFINEEEPSPDTTVKYVPYSYRIPSPGEFRMLCNIGLLRGAKGVFPFSLRSYNGWNDGKLEHHDTGLLDEDLIPFDAPYEDWVYRERPSSDYYYAPPDSIPPWTAADGSDFDPLYDLPARPVLSPNDPKNHEYYLEWKFASYGRLWNSVKKTFGQIARVAPELSRLWWWYDNNHYDDADINYVGAEPQYFADPHIRVFTDSTETDCYLFYVNRFCRADNNPFEITVDARDFPSGTPFSEYALDHSRRFLVEGSFTSPSTYSFLDTLDAGESRLLQMFDDGDGLDADIRITDPDLTAILPAKGDTLTDCRGLPDETLDILARFYNMGTEPIDSVRVFLYNETTDEVLDRGYVSFAGLSTTSCWTTDRDDIILSWTTPDSTYLGANVLSVYTEELNEPDTTDNRATLVYIVDPRDYATEILDDPWDMTEATGPGAPEWYTNDIDTLTGCWNLYTDSISGMFEGQLSDPSTADELVMNTGSGFADYIDADTYINLSLAGRSRVSADIEVHWIDEHNNEYETTLADGFTSTAADLGPYDLSEESIYWTGDVKKLWFEFDGGNAAVNVRIGWVKLTE